MCRLLVITLWFCCASTSAKVWQDGSNLHYTGDITPVQNQQAKQLLVQTTGKVQQLVIQSGGGNVYAGMDLAEIMLEYQLDLVVDKFCFSSCANYVFIAGKNKFIQPNAILGWHGNAASAKWLDQDIDAMLPELKGNRSAEKWQQLRRHYDEVIQRAAARETELYKRLGVDPTLLTIGLLPELKAVALKQKARGWTMSIALLQAKGVKNIRTTAQQWQPRSAKNFPLLVLDAENEQ